MPERPRRSESKPDRAEAPGYSFDEAEWPEVPEAARPRRTVFDTLRPEHEAVLRAKGYDPVLLRTMPRRNDAEDHVYFVALLQGASEGTVFLDKSRSEALAAELRSRQLGGKKELRRLASVSTSADLKELLGWADTRHTFTGTTTMLSPEEVAEYERRVANFTQQEQARKSKEKKK